MAATTQSIFQSIEKNQLLGPADYKKVVQKWNKPGREAVDDPFRLARWLTNNRYLSLYQADKLLLDQGKELIYGSYRIKNRIELPPMAGWLVAEDKLRRQIYLQPVSGQSKATGFSEAVKSAVAFKHPQVVSILGMFRDGEKEFLVREYFAGESLQNLVDRKATLGAIPVVKLFSLLFNAVSALLEKGIYPGELDLASFWIGPVHGSTNSAPTKTVRIVDAGVSPSLLGQPLDKKINLPQEAAFRLGVAMYEALSGVCPYPDYDNGSKPFTAPGPQPEPLGSLRQDVPESIASFVDDLIHQPPGGKAEVPAHAAKQLRILIAAEDHSAVHEEHDGIHQSTMVVEARPIQATIVTEDDEEQTAADRMLNSIRKWLESMGIFGRDLIVFTAGSLTFLFIIIFTLVVFRWDLIPVLCLGLGAGVGYILERFFRSADSQYQVAELSPDEEK